MVQLELGSVLGHHVAEAFQVAQTHGLRELEIGAQRLAQTGLPEHHTLRDVSQ